MIRRWPILFILIPLVELYVIIAVGEEIGAFWTIILVLLTAIAGVNLLRVQGMSTLMRAQRNMAQGTIPAMEMMEGVALAVAGVMLITPGFITDSIGFLFLIPASRQAIIRYFMSKSRMQGGFGGQPTNRAAGWQVDQSQQTNAQNPGSKNSDDAKPVKTGRTIEGEYRRED